MIFPFTYVKIWAVAFATAYFIDKAEQRGQSQSETGEPVLLPKERQGSLSLLSKERQGSLSLLSKERQGSLSLLSKERQRSLSRVH